MSGIYIPGMEMPKNCASCDIACAPYLDRGLDGLLAKICRVESRRKDCPLVPVPPHGRLIDGDVADAISFTEDDAEGRDFYDGILYAADWISEQPTTIPASEE